MTEGEEREGEESETIHNTLAADNTDSTNNDNPWADRDNSLGIHIRHSDKGVTRGGVIALSDFFPYAKAFVENGGGSIFVATDSSLVIEEITSKWPKDIRSHVVYQGGTTLSRNDTGSFDLAVSHHQTNLEALTDILALSKCTYLVHGFSALSEAAIYLNPSLIERSVNLEHKDQDDKAKYTKFLKMIESSKRGRRKKEKTSVTFEREEENPIKGIIYGKVKTSQY